MKDAGFFITLFDSETLRLYLKTGIYGAHMKPEYGGISLHKYHYSVLADYACARKDAHIFFFLKREVVYAGQIIGCEEKASFFINGPYSPLGLVANARLFWDESKRTIYVRTQKEGIFTRKREEQAREFCQPYIIIFKDNLGMAGKCISSDELYFEIGKNIYPLPTNSIADMSFCTMTPFETRIALELIQSSPKRYAFDVEAEVGIIGDPLPYDIKLEKECVPETISEAYIEARVLADPALLPEEVRPKQGTVLCRQVPISPFKPLNQIDRADICFYRNSFEAGALPYLIIELKKDIAGNKEYQQAIRYLSWLNRCMDRGWEELKIYLLAPGFKGNIETNKEYEDKIGLLGFMIS